MNRIIKFRALKDDISNCNFVFGQLVYDEIGQPRITNDHGLTFHTCIKGTEGQFTGLLDKNGNEIYEGDILKSWYSRDLSMKDIVYTQEVVEYEIEQYLGEAGFEIPFLRNAQVIGNIYENPELIIE